MGGEYDENTLHEIIKELIKYTKLGIVWGSHCSSISEAHNCTGHTVTIV